MKTILANATSPPTCDGVAANETHIIRTPRLFMRPVNDTDANDYFALLSDPAVMKFVGIDTGKVFEREEAAQLINGAVKGWAQRGWGRWSVFTHDGEFLGFCGFRREDGLPELLTVFHQKYWGHGVAAEAAVECIEYGRTVFGFSEIKAFTNPKHSRAHHFLTKLGANFEGLVEFHGIVGSKYAIPQVMSVAA